MAALLPAGEDDARPYVKPSQAGALATRGRQLLRRGLISHAQHSLLDPVLWAARRPGSATLIASLDTLARMAGQARSTVAAGIAALEHLGLLQRVRRRIRTAWIWGGQASRQVANLYRLLPQDTGSDGRPVSKQALIIYCRDAGRSGESSARGLGKGADARLASLRK